MQYLYLKIGIMKFKTLYIVYAIIIFFKSMHRSVAHLKI